MSMPLKFACIHFLDVFIMLQVTLLQYYRFCTYKMFIIKSTDAFKDFLSQLE